VRLRCAFASKTKFTKPKFGGISNCFNFLRNTIWSYDDSLKYVYGTLVNTNCERELPLNISVGLTPSAFVSIKLKSNFQINKQISTAYLENAVSSLFSCDKRFILLIVCHAGIEIKNISDILTENISRLQSYTCVFLWLNRAQITAQ
jgi:hypothetical protein